ncbi:MAG: helix-turn-helix transcriptional regulator [Pseudomonadota bacterium]
MNNDASPHQQQIEAIWDGISNFGSARTDAALDFLFDRLCHLLDAQGAYWVGTVQMSDNSKHDPLSGWRPRAYRLFKGHGAWKETAQEANSRIKKGTVDPTFIATTRGAGNFRIFTRHQIVDEEWYQSSYYKTCFEPFGISDGIIVATPVGDGVESVMGMNRINHPTPHFNQKDIRRLSSAMRPMQWFHHQLMLGHGLLLADNPLTPSERRVLNGLLSEATEAEIAKQLGLAPSTVHTYSKRICNKYGVRGRTGLTALWLGR